MVGIVHEHWSWVVAQPALVPVTFLTLLRLASDHTNPRLSTLLVRAVSLSMAAGGVGGWVGGGVPTPIVVVALFLTHLRRCVAGAWPGFGWWWCSDARSVPGSQTVEGPTAAMC